MTVKIVAIPDPKIFSMKIDTMKFDAGCWSAGTSSRHGTTPMIERFTPM